MSASPGSSESADQAALLLLGGRRGVDAVARTAGFATSAALGRALQRHLGATPEGLRQFGRTGIYELPYGGPFHLSAALQYLGRDADNLSDRLEGDRLSRWFPVVGRQVAVQLTLGPKACRVDLGRERLAPEEALALHRLVRHVLGLEQPLAKFYRQAAAHPVLGPIVRPWRGVRVLQVPSLWEALCWAVMGQQINLAFAYKLRNRLIRLGNPGRDDTTFPLPFPSPEAVLRIPRPVLREHQFSRQKAEYVGVLARAILEGPLRDVSRERMDAEEAEAAMVSVKGIGRWSAAYGLMRGLGYMDALPVGDAGLRAALFKQFGLEAPPDIARQEELMEPFRPYRGLATYYLWRSLSAFGE